MSYTRRTATETVEKQAAQLDTDYSRTASRIMAMRRRAAFHDRMLAGKNECVDNNCNKEVLSGDLSTSEGITSNRNFRSFIEHPNALKKEYRPKNIPAIPTVSTLSDIISKLDNLADYCENCGEKRLAAEIDKVTNTLEFNNK